VAKGTEQRHGGDILLADGPDVSVTLEKSVPHARTAPLLGMPLARKEVVGSPAGRTEVEVEHGDRSAVDMEILGAEITVTRTPVEPAHNGRPKSTLQSVCQPAEIPPVRWAICEVGTQRSDRLVDQIVPVELKASDTTDEVIRRGMEFAEKSPCDATPSLVAPRERSPGNEPEQGCPPLTLQCLYAATQLAVRARDDRRDRYSFLFDVTKEPELVLDVLPRPPTSAIYAEHEAPGHGSEEVGVVQAELEQLARHKPVEVVGASDNLEHGVGRKHRMNDSRRCAADGGRFSGHSSARRSRIPTD
jgi:hypothetical protein